MSRSAAVLILTGVLGATMVACAASQPPTPSATAGFRGPVLAGAVATAGGASIDASFSAAAVLSLQALDLKPPPSLSCSAFAKGFRQDIPGGHGLAFAAPVVQTKGEHQLYLRVILADGYTGPGTYTQQTSPQLGGVADVAIVSGGNEVTQTYRSTDASVTNLTVRPDGSGSLSFSAWATNEVRAGNIAGHLSGVLNWSCQ